MILDIPLFDPELFIIEDVISLNDDEIIKKFTSKANHKSKIFKWDFGDNTPIVITDGRVIYHTYSTPGIYLVGNQACSYSWCCSDWWSPVKYKYVQIRKKEEKERSNMSSLLSTILEDPLFSVKDADFIIENISIKSLNGGINKKFTSLATNATLFRWQFGDTYQNPIIETTENPYYHTFREKGTYPVSHQTCIGPTCCSGWCTKSIDVQPIKDETGQKFIAMMGLSGFLFFIGKEKECKDHKTRKDCIKYGCEWDKEENKCNEKKETRKLKR